MKKVVIFLGPLMCLLLVVGFIQEVNNGPVFSIDVILARLNEFRYTFDDTLEIISFFRDADLGSYLKPWDSTLTGFDGFITNINNTVGGFFSVISVVMRVVLQGLWSLITDTLSLFGNLLFLFLDVLGFGNYTPSPGA